MTPEWKPGDVAMLTTEIGDEHIGMVVTTGVNLGVIAPTYQACSLGHRDQREAVIYAWGPSTVRPLVVIDPDDREQVDRLFDAFDARFRAQHAGTAREDMQAALRSLIAPPKPEEPTGRYAVVLDADGVEWLRSRDGIWAHSHTEGMRTSWVTRSWSSIAAVKVLSPGVPA